MESLNVRSFFTNFLIHPQSDQLTSKEKKIALGFSITIGVCSAGLVHLTAKIIELFRRKKIADDHSPLTAAPLRRVVNPLPHLFEERLLSIASSPPNAYNAAQRSEIEEEPEREEHILPVPPESSLRSIVISLSEAYNAAQRSEIEEEPEREEPILPVPSESTLHPIAISLSEAYNAAQRSELEKKPEREEPTILASSTSTLRSIAISLSDAYDATTQRSELEEEEEEPLEIRGRLPKETPQTLSSGSLETEVAVPENEIEPASENLTLKISQIISDLEKTPDPRKIKISDPMNLSMWLTQEGEGPSEAYDKARFRLEQEAIIRQCLSQHQGVILGEMHTSRNSKRFLIENMALFAELGVRQLFIEWEEEAEPQFEEFYANPEISEAFKRRLLRTDVLNIPRPEIAHYEQFMPSSKAWDEVRLRHESGQKYNHYQLFLSAKKHGIRLIPIDKRNLHRKYRQPGERRLPEMNKFAEAKIKSMITPNDKYIVFCGIYHAFQVKKDEPGLNKRLDDIPVIYTSEFAKETNSILRSPIERRVILPDYYVQYAKGD